MTTPITRAAVSIVSLVGATVATLSVGACARGPAPITWDGSSASSNGRLALHFENEAETYVDVYLVTQQRQLRLGRVAPGARGTLWIPETALTSTSSFVRLAVLAGAPLTLDPAHDARATFTILEPSSELFSQRWTFSKTPLASAELRGAPVDARRW